MILDFVRQQNTGSFIPDMKVNDIAAAIGTDELGTPLIGIERINEKLLKAVPSVEFETKTNCDLQEIEKEVQQGKPVIVWLRIPHPHSIVVTGLNSETLTVFLNDPQRGKRQMEMGRFMSAWANMDNILIKAKIGEKLQRVIPEFVEKEENGSEGA